MHSWLDLVRRNVPVLSVVPTLPQRDHHQQQQQQQHHGSSVSSAVVTGACLPRRVALQHAPFILSAVCVTALRCLHRPGLGAAGARARCCRPPAAAGEGGGVGARIRQRDEEPAGASLSRLALCCLCCVGLPCPRFSCHGVCAAIVTTQRVPLALLSLQVMDPARVVTCMCVVAVLLAVAGLCW
jgi:hypothetical protein